MLSVLCMVPHLAGLDSVPGWQGFGHGLAFGGYLGLAVLFGTLQGRLRSGRRSRESFFRAFSSKVDAGSREENAA